MLVQTWPIKGGYHASGHAAGRDIVARGKTESEARDALMEAFRRAEKLQAEAIRLRSNDIFDWT
jgi:hypothetical protein